jgi:transposase
MSTEVQPEGRTIGSEVISREEVPMVRRERWEELRRLAMDGGVAIAELARQFGLDRKTVRRCVREPAWRPYQRPARAGTLLAAHTAYLRDRAPQVGYSAQILFQELRQHGYPGSYETVKLFVRPLRAAQWSGGLTLRRFETPPGQQSQVDWGTATIPFRQQRQVRHVFVLTLGFSRRSYYHMCPNETLPQFLDAHERAFEYFGGHTREHLYDRPRTVCLGATDGRIVWNATFKAFAEYWSFEPRVCQPYRAQTKGKVESGVKYFKGNFLPGRTFVDDVDLHEQLTEWSVTIADVRIHGTTHERPIERFAQEQAALVPTASQPSSGSRRAWPASWPRTTWSVSTPIAIRSRSPSSARRSRCCAGPASSWSSTAAAGWPSTPSSTAGISSACSRSTGLAPVPARRGASSRRGPRGLPRRLPSSTLRSAIWLSMRPSRGIPR